MVDRFRLKVFVTLAECGSFSAAARALGISQPAVSQNVAELEKYAGTRLLCRSRSGVSLTGRGRLFLRKAAAVLEAYDALDGSCKAPQSVLLLNVLLRGEKTNVLVDRGFFADLDAPSDVAADRRIDVSGLEIRPSMFDCYADLDRLPSLSSGVTFLAGSCRDYEDSASLRDQYALRIQADVPYPERALMREETLDGTGVLALPKLTALRQEELKRAFAFARRRGLLLRAGLAATAEEQADCLEAFSQTPLRYLDSLGVLGGDVLLTDCSFADAEEWRIMARRRVKVVHCPSSELAASGVRYPYEQALASGVRICLGGRGRALSDEVRAVQLLSSMGHPALSRGTVSEWATKNGADAFGIDAGEISYGKLADFVLSLPEEGRTPGETSCIRYVFCRGQILFDFRSHHEFDEVA